jgi:hypothetical protein
MITKFTLSQFKIIGLFFLFQLGSKNCTAQTADPTPRIYQFFKANVPFTYEDSSDYTVIYSRPPISEFTKEYRPWLSYTMRQTNFEIGGNERKIFTQQLIKEYIGKTGKLVLQKLEGDKAEFWYTNTEKKISYMNKIVVKFSIRRFVIIAYKDLNKKTPFQDDIQNIFNSIEFL